MATYPLHTTITPGSNLPKIVQIIILGSFLLKKKNSEASYRYIFWEDWSQSENISEIKPPLGWHSLSKLIIELPRDPHHIFPYMFQGHRKW